MRKYYTLSHVVAHPSFSVRCWLSSDTLVVFVWVRWWALHLRVTSTPPGDLWVLQLFLGVWLGWLAPTTVIASCIVVRIMYYDVYCCDHYDYYYDYDYCHRYQ